MSMILIHQTFFNSKTGVVPADSNIDLVTKKVLLSPLNPAHMTVY